MLYLQDCLNQYLECWLDNVCLEKLCQANSPQISRQAHFEQLYSITHDFYSDQKSDHVGRQSSKPRFNFHQFETVFIFIPSTHIRNFNVFLSCETLNNVVCKMKRFLFIALWPNPQLVLLSCLPPPFTSCCCSCCSGLLKYGTFSDTTPLQRWHLSL